MAFCASQAVGVRAPSSLCSGNGSGRLALSPRSLGPAKGGRRPGSCTCTRTRLSFGSRKSSSCAAQSSSSGGGFSDAAGNAFDAAKKRVEELNKQHNVSGKAAEFTRAASKSFKQKYDEVEDGVKRTVRETNRKYDVKGKANAAFSSVKDTVDTADQRLGIRKKIQLLFADLKRNWPAIQRNLTAFFRSPLGRITFFIGLYYALVSGWLLKIISYIFLLSWLALILGVPRRFMAAAQERAAQQAGGSAGPGAGFSGGNPYGGSYAGNPYAQAAYQQQQARRQQPGQQQKWGTEPGGAVVDVEWSTVDEEKPKK